MNTLLKIKILTEIEELYSSDDIRYLFTLKLLTMGLERSFLIGLQDNKSIDEVLKTFYWILNEPVFNKHNLILKGDKIKLWLTKSD